MRWRKDNFRKTGYGRAEMKPDANMTISDLLEWQPQTASIFIQRKMLCIGCPAEAFHTLGDAARLYGFDLTDFIAAIDAVVRKDRQT